LQPTLLKLAFKNSKCEKKAILLLNIILKMAKDLYHLAVRAALEKDGWTITHDPFRLVDKKANMSYEVDSGAEKLLAAEKGSDFIAVEIKSFLKTSFTHEFHGILGQYIT
jgi:hypothetical protein